MLGLSVATVWLDCLALGGSLSPERLGAFLGGEGELSDHDHDVVAHALNERFADLALNHPLAYAEDLRSPS